MPSKGLLVGIEGIDAAGKRTQSALLLAWLRARGVVANAISFPDYSTALGAEIRGFLLGRRDYSPEVRHMLFAANRWEKKNQIENLLEQAQVVIVNRYTESNLAYGVANGLNLEWLISLETGLPKTDMVLVLDASTTTFYDRRNKKKDRYESDLALQERARRAYLELSKRFGWKVINAAQGIQDTNRLIIESVSTTLSAKERTQ
jgi:dTMP kinase